MIKRINSGTPHYPSQPGHARNAFGDSADIDNIIRLHPEHPSASHEIAPAETPTFAIGLMGGGSWGAFSAGVLEEILGPIEKMGHIKIIAGTSAGAGNAAMAASGLNDGGSALAKDRLRHFWNRVKTIGGYIGYPRGLDFMVPPSERWPNVPSQVINLMSAFKAANPFFSTGATHMISNIAKSIVPNWRSVQRGDVKCVVNTVRQNLLTGEREHILLSGDDLTPQGLGASAALKELGLHQIHDRHRLDDFKYAYLDGGYAQNPPLEPLLAEKPSDIILIILHDANQEPDPHEPSQNPRDKIYRDEIHTDVATLSLADSNLTRVHTIEIEVANGKINGWEMNDRSKLNASAEFIDALYKAGREAGRKWLAENADQIGVESTYRPHKRVVQNLIAQGLYY